MAIKAVIRSKLTTKLLENLESEIRLLKNIKQRNVVELLDCLVSLSLHGPLSHGMVSLFVLPASAKGSG